MLRIKGLLLNFVLWSALVRIKIYTEKNILAKSEDSQLPRALVLIYNLKLDLPFRCRTQISMKVSVGTRKDNDDDDQ